MRRRLRFIGKFKPATKDGKSFYLYNNAFHLETDIYWLGIDVMKWENMTRSIWCDLSVTSNVIFDIGANSGIFSILSKVYHPESFVVGFEPQPNIFNVLKKNNSINKFDIRCENLALADINGEMLFYNYGSNTFTSENTTAGSLNKKWRPALQHSITVNVEKLENYIEKNRINTIDLMKIDVETMEYEVLIGYGKFLYMHQPIIILEIQDEVIGKKVASLFNRDWQFYNINEKKGLQKVDVPGNNTDKNYLICPVAKLNLITNYI